MKYEYNSFLEPYICAFLEQKKKSVSSFTYAHLCGVLQHFDHNVVDNGYTDLNFTEEQVFQWMSTLKVKNSTISCYVTGIKSFFTFLEGYGFHPFSPSSHRGSDEYIAYDFSDEEIDLIFSIADNYVPGMHPVSPDKPHPRRKYKYIQFELPMFLRLLFGCGLRREEAACLTLRDINFQNRSLIIRKTKSHEYRIVPMDQSLSNILFEYCKCLGLGSDMNAYIFPGVDFSNPIPAYCFQNYFKRVLTKAGISLIGRKKHERGPCLHCFRHAFVHRSFKKGVQEGWATHDQVPWLSVYLGHKGLQETEKYLKTNSDMFDDEIDLFESFSMNVYPEVNFNE